MSDRLRIAHVALQLETGGMERLLTEFAAYTDRSRFDLHLIALSQRGRLADEIEAHGWPVFAMNAPPGVRPSIVHRLAKLFKAERVNIVHTHNTKPLIYAGPAARLAGVGGVIHTRHGQRRGATPIHNRLFHLGARCVDRMVCVSEDAAALCRREGINPDLLCTIHNGIDTSRFAFTGPNPEGPAVYVGRLSPEKDIVTLLRAAAVVCAQEQMFTLQIAGRGPCEGELRALSAAMGLTRRVRFLGEVTDIPALLRTASFFVLPSLSEGLPVTVLEAMACGLPVVATAVGGTGEAVEDGRSGRLVPAGDPSRLADAMLAMWRNRGEARQMGISGRKRVEAQFDIRTMIARYESLYGDVSSAEARLAA